MICQNHDNTVNNEFNKVLKLWNMSQRSSHSEMLHSWNFSSKTITCWWSLDAKTWWHGKNSITAFGAASMPTPALLPAYLWGSATFLQEKPPRGRQWKQSPTWYMLFPLPGILFPNFLPLGLSPFPSLDLALLILWFSKFISSRKPRIPKVPQESSLTHPSLVLKLGPSRLWWSDNLWIIQGCLWPGQHLCHFFHCGEMARTAISESLSGWLLSWAH